MKDLRAGAAKRCITPPERMRPAYNTAFHVEYSYVQDDIYVRTLVLESGGQRMLFIVLELNDMGRTEDMKNAVASACGIDPAFIFPTVTHTHETPAIDYTHYKGTEDPDEEDPDAPKVGYTYKEPKKAGVVERVIAYGDFVIEQVVACTQEAIAALTDARIGYGKGESYVNVNSSGKSIDGLCYGDPDPAGKTDRTLAVLKVTGLDGKVIAILSNYAVHGAFCFLQKGVGVDDLAISGDLPGMAADFVEQHYQKDGTICLWTSGAAADQMPYNAHMDMSWDPVTLMPQHNALGEVVWTLCRHTAQWHGLDIIRVAEGIQPDIRELSFQSDACTVTTAAQKEVGNVKSLDDIVIEENGTVDIKLRVVTAGDFAFLGINGELSSPIGVHLRELSLFPYTFVIPHNAERVEYLITKEEYDSRATIFYRTIVKDGVTEELITPEYCRMLNQMRDNTTKPKEA